MCSRLIVHESFIVVVFQALATSSEAAFCRATFSSWRVTTTNILLKLCACAVWSTPTSRRPSKMSTCCSHPSRSPKRCSTQNGYGAVLVDSQLVGSETCSTILGYVYSEIERSRRVLVAWSSLFCFFLVFHRCEKTIELEQLWKITALSRQTWREFQLSASLVACRRMACLLDCSSLDQRWVKLNCWARENE